jgi:hypothetical protein
MINETITVPNNNKRYNMMGTKITILEVSMKTQGIMYPQWAINRN